MTRRMKHTSKGALEDIADLSDKILPGQIFCLKWFLSEKEVIF